MSDTKSFASLSPTLLARKGGAKPAMRRQQAQASMYHDALGAPVEDDLGWNDMGDDHAAPAAAVAPVPELVAVDRAFVPAQPVAAPAVLAQQETIVERVVAARAIAPAASLAPLAPAAAAAPAVNAARAAETAPAKAPRRSAAAAPVRRSAAADGRRAAFTLRVDAERHLKLRLACTVRGRSAQQLVTEALDRLLDELPELSTLAAQLARKH